MFAGNVSPRLRSDPDGCSGVQLSPIHQALDPVAELATGTTPIVAPLDVNSLVGVWGRDGPATNRHIFHFTQLLPDFHHAVLRHLQ